VCIARGFDAGAMPAHARVSLLFRKRKSSDRMENRKEVLTKVIGSAMMQT
jgi:hypothetical protein